MRWAVQAIALGIAILMATSGPLAAADTPYEINVILPLTGPAAFFGASAQRGMRVIEDLVNAQGGINGRPLRFVLNDDGTNPQTVIQLTTALIAKQVPVIMGPGISAECTAQFPVVENSGPVTYCFSPVVHPKPNGFSFMTGPAIGDVEPVVLRYFRSRGFRNFALITSTDASGQEFERTFDLALALPEFRDVKLVAREHFNISDISVSAQVARIKAARPEVLLTFTTGTPFGTLLHGLYDAGLEIPVYGSGGNLNNAQMAQYAAFLPKELYLNGVHGVIPDPTATGKMKQAQQIYFDALKRASYHPEFSLLSVWDPTMIVVDALRKLRSDVTAQQLHDYLEHLKGWTGVEGTYDFTSGDQRGIGQAATALFRWDATAIDWVQVSPAPHHR